MKLDYPKLALLCLFICFGSLYLLLVPPWQGADEPTHFEQVHLFWQAGPFSPSPALKQDLELQRRLIQTMDEFSFWRYVGVARPSELPDRFSKAPFISMVATQMRKPELLYRLSGLYLQCFPVHDLIGQMYLLRFLSLFFSTIGLLFLYEISLLVFKQRRDQALFLISTILLLPQYALVAVSVNTDPFLQLVYYGFLLSLLRGKMHGLTGRHALVLLCWALLCVGTERQGWMVVPVGLYHYWKDQTGLFLKYVFLWMGAFLCVGLPLFILLGWFWPALATELINQLAVIHLKLTLGKAALPATALPWTQLVLAYISSFFCSAGWMTYSLPSGLNTLILYLVGAGSVGFIMAHSGLIRPWRNLDYDRVSSAIGTLFFNFILLAAISVLVYMTKGIYAQGRFLFPVVWPIMYLICFGILDVLRGLRVPERVGPALIFTCLFLLNVYTLGTLIIPVFHVG
ncbi:hypothetical protein JXQ70_00025 [bacterium]|nr:hypothetical protein [bacterium]